MTADIVTEKVCTKCGIAKPVTEFYKAGDKLKGDCKSCYKISSYAWRANNPEKVKAALVAWRLTNADIIKAKSSAWYKSNTARANANNAAWRESNLERKKASDKAWKEANPERMMASIKAWRIANIERAKSNVSKWSANNPEKRRIHSLNRRARKIAGGGTVLHGLAAKLFKLQRGKCPCCGLPLGDNYHMDHIMPLALGGIHTDSNMQLLRQRCNNQKHSKHPLDFMQSRGFLL